MLSWFYLFIISIPIILFLIFAFSIIYARESKFAKQPKLLGYGVCSMDSILNCGIIIFLMICIVIVLQILAYSDLYSNNEVCMPILYYFGNKEGCKKAAARTANIHTRLYNIQKTIQEIESYKTNNIDTKQYLNNQSVENFENKYQKWISFREIFVKFYKMYFSAFKYTFSYFYKIYHDLIFPLVVT